MSTETDASKKLAVKRRGGHKAYTTKIVKESRGLIDAENPKNKAKLNFK